MVDYRKEPELIAVLYAMTQVVGTKGEKKCRLQLKILERREGRRDIFIRACQGHSWVPKAEWAIFREIVRDDNLNGSARRLAPYPECALHGTTWEAVQGILTIGFSCRPEHNSKEPGHRRTHLHMVPTTAKREADSGFVANAPYIVDISWADAMSYGGHRFYYSDNEVLLSPGRDGILEPIFIRGVWEAHTGRYWRSPCFMDYSCSGAAWPARDTITKWLNDETRWMRTQFKWTPDSNKP